MRFRGPIPLVALFLICTWLLTSALVSSKSPVRPQPGETPLVLYDAGRVTARIVVSDHPSALEELAITNLNETLRHIWGFELPVIPVGVAQGDLSAAIVVGTPKNHSALEAAGDWLSSSLEPLGSEGFLIQPVDAEKGPHLIVASTSGRGVLQGVGHLANFLIQAQGQTVAAKTAQVSRQPAIGLRGTYNLVCWGLTPRYTRQHWEKVIDAMAEDGMNFIYFWLSGIFRSELFPESFIYPETPLTNEDIRALIRYAHSRGVDFYLGTGVFAWFGIDEIAKHNDELRELGIQHMCRTLPAAQKAMKSYLLELYDAFPEAKGMWLEIGCEGNYHCRGELCQRQLDEFGSKQIGMSELSFLKEFSAELWKKRPEAKLVWGMGYPEAHKWDVKYYDRLRREFDDPRYYFMETRQNWSLQDHQGILKPLPYTSPRILHWDQYYRLPLREIGERARRIHQDGLAGYAVAFEPGFNTHSVYGKRIPFPVDLIPYRLTRFAYREFTREPNLAWEHFRQRLLEYFFGEGQDPELVDLTLTIFELMQTGPIRGSFRELTEPPSGVAGYAKMLKPRLAVIETRLAKLEPRMSEKAKAVGLPLLRTAIHDLREAYSIQ